MASMYRKFTNEQVKGLSDHARAVLIAFDDVDWPRFEGNIRRNIPVLDTPLSLTDDNVPCALEELAAAGLIETWTPTPDADPVKPHPQMCLRQYWPPGRIWVRRGTNERDEREDEAVKS